MLTRLTIENVALVEKADLELHEGLLALTGETGAGKSVIVTALWLALGERADREYVRPGAQSARVTAEFDLAALPAVSEPFDGHLGAGCLRIEREIHADGTSRARINDRPASLAAVKRLTSALAEIIGQHAGQMLMNEDNHLLFLDRFAGLEPSREEVAQLFEQWQHVRGRLQSMRKQRQQLIDERQLLLYQKDEIDKAQLRPGEEDELLAERRILDSTRTLMTAAGTIEQVLDSDETSVAGLLSLARKEAERMAAIDSSLRSQLEILTEMGFQVEELRRFVQQYGASIQDDPQRLEEINQRLSVIYNLKKKYGGSEEAVLKSLAEINQRLKDRPDIDDAIAGLEKQDNQLDRGYSDKAVTLSEARRRAARRLKTRVIDELKKLAIDRCDFECEFLYEDDPSGVRLDKRCVRAFVHGLEKARFLFSANPGMPLRSLVRTASGGEISRVLLALKSAERAGGRLTHALLVFDEVDAGIGGRTATAVGNKLKELSHDCQVLVITHLHQIARLSDHHFVAEKRTDRNHNTTIAVRKLAEEEIPAELDRMVALPEGA